MPTYRFHLPPPRRGNPLWVVPSIIVHVVLVVIVASVAGSTLVQRETVTVITLLPPGMAGPREHVMPVLGEVGGGGGVQVRRGSAVAATVPGARIDTTLPPVEAQAVIIGLRGGPLDSAGTVRLPRGRRLIGPAYGDGRLWVRTLEAELGVVGPSETVEMHVARVDSAVRERIKAFIDTMPRDSFALPAPPKWTVEAGDNTWGIDGRWIYLGDIKIPTALLALLPWPQGNIEQARSAAELQRIRQDIIQAAERAETAAQFRRYVDAVRKRKQAERDSLRALPGARRDTIKP